MRIIDYLRCNKQFVVQFFKNKGKNLLIYYLIDMCDYIKQVEGIGYFEL